MNEKPQSSSADLPLLRMSSICKRFDGIVALEDVHLTVRKGEIHALVGENGAGKSTLIKILAGFYAKDRGEITFDGRELLLRSPLDSQRAGISVIYQDFDLASNMTIEENLLLGKEPVNLCFVRRARQTELAMRYLEAVGLSIDTKAMVGSLTVAHRQLVAVAKALSSSARILVMDEPTSALSVEEIDNLLTLIMRLKGEGTSIVYISHKMDEVFRISDSITVLRDGRNVGTRKTAETSRREIISMMVGRNLDAYFNKSSRIQSEVLLEVEDLTRSGGFRGVSFQVRRGEILGIYGLKGSGRTEIARALFGLDRPDAGEIRLHGRRVAFSHPHRAIRSGLGLIPEDRSRSGLFPNMNVRENVSIAYLDRCSRFGFLQKGRERELVKKFVDLLRIRVSGIDQMILTLSGGNQQKVVLARWLSTRPSVLLLDEPTVGIDVGAKSEIYRLMNDLAAEGIGLVLISSELPEILAMSDRILVLHGGGIVAEFAAQEASEDKIINSIHSGADAQRGKQ
jgi:ABC-type sugar transport system ATPase subunit